MELFNNYPTEVLILIFLIVTFLQSGIDKIVDWNGNQSFIKEHFKQSPLKNGVPFLLGVILVLELLASVFMIYGTFLLMAEGQKQMALIGIELAGIALIFLLIGQRLAKDYAGAMTLAVYFATTMFGVYLLSQS